MVECPLKNVRWVLEENFSDQFKQEISDTYSNHEYICFMVDDCIFYRPYPYSIKDTLKLITDDVLCFSWRLGLNTTKQYYVDNSQQIPLGELGYSYFGRNYFEGDTFIKWNWKIRPPHMNYGYWFSLDCHIYRSSDIYDICKDFKFHNPRALESKMVNSDIRASLSRKYMISEESGHIFVNTVNCCQAEKIPSGIFHSYPLEVLNEQYLRGYTIDLNAFDFEDEDVSGCHGEMPIIWKKGC